MKVEVEIEVLSPIHLGSGQADVSLDADVIHDAYGMPYFPARRFKGLLYESAQEVLEMGARAGLKRLAAMDLQAIFHRDTDAGAVQIVVSDFHLERGEDHRAVCEAWRYLQERYAALLRPQDVLETYTSIRWQTKLQDGVAVDGSLRNMRVVEAGVTFYGVMEVYGERANDILPLLAAALRNMKTAGMKRNRGFGQIRCRMRLPKEPQRTLDELLQEVLA